MKRYHIFKLSFAIIFYAAYCIRPMMVNGLETADDVSQIIDNNNKTRDFGDEYVYYQGVQGKPGVDFPVLSHIPRTGFSCRDLDSGYYADLDTDCQVFHICEDGRKISFLCPNGTVFQQSELICEWWFKVNCTNAPNLYEESAEQLREDNARRKASRRVISNVDNYGAVMRTEERASISTSQRGNNFEIISKQQPQKVRVVEGNRVNNQRPPVGTSNHDQIKEDRRNDHNYERKSGGNNKQQKLYQSGDNNENDRNRIPLETLQDNLRVDDRNGQSDEYVRISVSNTARNNQNPTSIRSQSNEYVRITAGNVQSKNRNRPNEQKGSRNRNGNQQVLQSTNGIGGNRQNSQSHKSSSIGSPNEKGLSGGQIVRNRNSDQNTGNHQNSDQGFKSKPNGNFNSQGTSYNRNLANSDRENANGENYENRQTSSSSINAEGNQEQFQNAETQDFRSSFNRNSNDNLEKSPSNDNSFNNQYNSNGNNYRQGPSHTEDESRNSNTGNVKHNQDQNSRKFYTQFSKNNPDRNKGAQQQNNQQNHQNTQQNNDEPIRIDCCSQDKKTANDNAQSNLRGKNQGSNNENIKLKLSVSLQNRNNIDNNNGQKVDGSRGNPQRSLESIGSDNNNDQNDTAKFPGKQSNVRQQSTVSYSTKNDFVNVRFEPTESEESQVPQETASFVKSSFNSIAQTHKTTANPHPNHRETYSDLKEPQYYSTKILSAISSVTPQYLTTQSINNGRPFIGSQVGTTRKPDPTIKSSIIYDGDKSNEKVDSSDDFGSRISTELPATLSFNVGRTRNTNQYLPTVSTTEGAITNSIPTERFNVGNTDYNTIKSAVVFTSTVVPPKNQNLDIPSSGSFNLGQVSSVTSIPEVTTNRIVDHATVYGKFVKNSAGTTTPVPLVSSTNAPTTKLRYQSSRSFGETFETADSFNSLGNNRKNIIHSGTKVSSNPTTLKVSHSKLEFDSTYSTTPSYSTVSNQSPQNSGFYVTKPTEFSTRIPSNPNGVLPTARSVSGNVVKPRPFQLAPKIESKFNIEVTANSIAPTYPTYKISSASPFTAPTENLNEITLTPTEPTTLVTTQSTRPFENVDSMINALVKMAAPLSEDNDDDDDHSAESPRPGLIIPPSAGPQTLHTLAVYFANALDDIVAYNRDEEIVDPSKMTDLELEKKKVTELLTKMTMDRYNELFIDTADETGTTESTTVSARFGETTDDLEGQHSKNPAQTPKYRQLAKVFTQALSSYLDDPATFKKVLQEVRPTEPPSEGDTEDPSSPDSNNNEDELLNFSDADSKSSYPPIFPTAPSVRPTWGYLVAFNTSQVVQNSLSPDSENLQSADSQSFVSQFNKLKIDVRESSTKSSVLENSGLPNGHWTSSPGATKLWKTAFSFDPSTINNDFDGTTTEALPLSITVPTNEKDIDPPLLDVAPPKFEPHHEIKYELRSLPKLALNSTQVHGILIDFMNTTKLHETNRLQRILRKLNTTEDEFLARMKEIEGNPLTRRLILLLISECGTDATKEIQTDALPVHELVNRGIQQKQEILETSSSIGAGYHSKITQPIRTGKSSSNLKDFVDPNLDEDSEDTRALQLLNSLYTIASRFGK